MNKLIIKRNSRLAENACHHFSRFLDENILDIRHALERQSQYPKMTKHELKGPMRKQAHYAARRAIYSCTNMDRLDRAMAAVSSIAGGASPMELSPIYQQILRTRERMEQVRQHFYPPVCYAEQRIRADLSAVIGPLCDELQALVIAYYNVAKSLYDLPDLNGTGLP